MVASTSTKQEYVPMEECTDSSPQGANALVACSSPTHGSNSSSSSVGHGPDSRLENALQQLRQVDLILDQLGIFWANTEVVLEMLTKKGQRAEQFVAFSHKPQLMARFRQLMTDYGRFWSGVKNMCHNYIHGQALDADLGHTHKGADGKDFSGEGSATPSSQVPRSESPSTYDFTGVDDSRERFLDRNNSMTPPRSSSGGLNRKMSSSASSMGSAAPVHSATASSPSDGRSRGTHTGKRIV